VNVIGEVVHCPPLHGRHLHHDHPGSRVRAWARAALVLTAVVIVDQATKALVRGGIDVGDEDSILPGVSLVHVRNTGVAFGAFAGGGLIVIALVAAALAALVFYFVTHVDRPLVWLPTGLLLGGSLGNIIDRVRDGAVTDFIKLPHWPAFNVADIAITFGVLTLLWVIEQGGEDRRGADGRAG
jgi:signal peptidase II